MTEVTTQILSDITVYMKYARYLPKKGRREVWNELVTRNKNMHIKTYPQLKEEKRNLKSYAMLKKQSEKETQN